MNKKKSKKKRIRSDIEVFDLPNLTRSEFRTSIDLRNLNIRIDEMEVAEELQDAGEVVIIPCKEDLYDYGSEVKNFLNERRIVVPEGERVRSYMREKNLLDEFDIEVQETVQRNFKKWLKERKFEIEFVNV